MSRRARQPDSAWEQEKLEARKMFINRENPQCPAHALFGAVLCRPRKFRGIMLHAHGTPDNLNSYKFAGSVE